MIPTAITSRAAMRMTNGNVLSEVYPWGTIRIPTPDQNAKEVQSLSPQERDEIRQRVWQYLDVLDYRSIA